MSNISAAQSFACILITTGLALTDILQVSVPQASFHAHFKQTDHNGMKDWSFTLIDHATNTKAPCQREMYWQYKFNTFNLNGLNERDVILYT